MIQEQPIILLIEDDPSLAASLENILSFGGYSVVWSDNPTHVTEGWLETPPSLVIVNAAAQAFEGKTALQAIKELAPEIPVIALDTSERGVYEASALQPDRWLRLPATFFSILDTLQDMLRTQASQIPLPAPELPTQGSLGQDLSMTTLLHHAFLRQFTGHVVVEQGRARRVLFLLRGFPVGASSNIHTEVFGNMLVQRGMISREELQQALGNLARTNLSIGQYLVEHHLITASQRQRVLIEQVRERILGCFEQTEGNFQCFATADGDPPQGEALVQNTLALLQLAIARFRKSEDIEEELTARLQDYVIPTVNFARQVPYLRLGLRRREILAFVDGRHTLQQLQERWRGNRPAWLSLIATLHDLGMILFSPTVLPLRDDQLRALKQLSPLNLGRLIMPRRTRASAVEVNDDAYHSGTFRSRGIEAPRILRDLLASTTETLDTKDHFELFGLDVDATSYQIHNTVRPLLQQLSELSVDGYPEVTQTVSVSDLSRRLHDAADVLLNVVERRAYRAAITPVSGQRIAAIRDLLDRKEIDEALEALEALDAEDPTNPQVSTLLANALYHKYEASEHVHRARTQALLTRAIALDDQNTDAFYLLGLIERDRGDLELARAAWQRALAIDPGHPHVVAALAGLDDA